jgi:hypothetical protein
MAASNITTASIHSEDKPSKLIKVQSKDEQIFEIDEGIIEQFTALKELYESMFTYRYISCEYYYFT